MHIQSVHEGRRDYNCNKCNKDFQSASYLRKHIQCVHEGRMDYKCKQCSEDFSTAHFLKKHVKNVHEGRRDLKLASDKEENSKETDKVPTPDIYCTKSSNVIDKNPEVKYDEHYDIKEMPTFESEPTYLDDKIRKEIKIEPLESISVEEKSTGKIKNMVPNSRIKREQIEFEEMPIFERDSSYLEEAIKQEIKIEPHC